MKNFDLPGTRKPEALSDYTANVTTPPSAVGRDGGATPAMPTTQIKRMPSGFKMGSKR